MYIKDIYLENFLGLQEGTGRSELFIDFAAMHAAGVQRCLLLGRNGSGKTTLLNALTPFPSQGDDRSTVIIPGRAGRKVITFVKDGVEVKCDIRWSAKGKASCFMFIDGSEEPLRETAKGNIGEYLAAVEAYLGVTPEYLKIGRVGGRVDGFLGLGPSKRKEYIGQFMPEVEEWVQMHKNASKRLSLLKAQLSGMQVELDRIEPREELDAARFRALSDCDRLRESIRQLDLGIGSASGAIAEMRPQLLDFAREAGLDDIDDIGRIPDIVGTARSAAERAAAAVTQLVASRPVLQRFLDPAAAEAKVGELRETVARLSGERDSLYAQRSSARGRLDRAIADENAARGNLRKIESSDAQLTQLRAQLTQLAEKVEVAQRDAERYPDAVQDGLTYEAVKVVTDALMGLEGEVADLRNQFPSPEALDTAVSLGMDEDLIGNSVARISTALAEVKQTLDTAKVRATTIEAQAQFHGRFKGMHCADPRCPFERHIGQYASAAEELGEKRDQIRSLEERVANMEVEVRDGAATKAAARAVRAAHSRIRKHKEVLEATGVWEAIGPQSAFFALVSAPSTVAASVLSVQRLLDALRVKRDLAEAVRTHAGVKERIEHLESLRAAKEQLTEAVNRAAEATATARSEHEAVEASVAEKSQQVTAQEAALKLLTDLTAHQATEREKRAEVARLEDVLNRSEALRVRWAGLETDLARLNGEREGVAAALTAAESALTQCDQKLTRRDEYEARLAEIRGKVATATHVVEACHPARGAPVEFLREFLDSTRDEVNDLLDVAMRGEFRIGFALSDSEFRIPVSKSSGRVIPDVVEASEGQIALAKTVISMALIKQLLAGMGGYNVVCLDEVDGPLDKERNRERFAEIMDRLTLELGLEQIFMISHNDNFHAAPAGLVLLPGHAMPVDDRGFMSNKLLLADFS